MHALSDWRYVGEYLAEDGEPLATTVLEPDFGPALECCRLAGIDAGVLPASTLPPSGRVEPVWADEVGAPRVKSLRASMDAFRGDDPVVVDLDVSLYLRSAVRRGASRLVEEKKIVEGSYYRHRVLAFAVAATSPAPDGDGLQLDVDEDDANLVPIAPREMPGEPAVDDDATPCPVFVHAEVERDLLELAAEAGDKECGAGLLGHLARDPRSGRLFVEVTALAPARGGLSEQNSFAFTDESWASIHEIAALRGRGELLCGYAHSHPNFCAKCPPERHGACVFSKAFFSNDDVHLQRTCFPSAWQVALLASHLPGGERVVNLFGWRSGVVCERAYTRIADRTRKTDDDLSRGERDAQPQHGASA